MTTNPIETQTPEVLAATKALDTAQEAQRIARKNLDDQNAALEAWRKQFEEAKKALDAAKPALSILKAHLQKADADVTIARAELSKLAPEKVASNGNGTSQAEVSKAVTEILKTAGPEGLTTDDIFTRLQANGVEMAGAKPRENLGVYIARWAKVPGSAIFSVGRGKWTAFLPEPPEVPAFLAPTETVVVNTEVKVPDFLGGNGLDESVKTDTDVNGTALPADLPGRDALVEAGYDTIEKVKHKTHDQLRRIKGVGAGTAKEILAALNPTEA